MEFKIIKYFLDHSVNCFVEILLPFAVRATIFLVLFPLINTVQAKQLFAMTTLNRLVDKAQAYAAFEVFWTFTIFIFAFTDHFFNIA